MFEGQGYNNIPFLEVNMQLGTLRYNLRKCNPDIFIDIDHEAYPFGYTEYPVGGLYINGIEGVKYIMGVPHGNIPEYSIAAVDFNELIREGKLDEIQQIIDTGYAWNKERLIWRGWRAIVNNLIRMGHIDKRKAEKVFNTYFEPNRIQLPRNYINREI